MTDVVILDIETSGHEPWSGELLCVGVGDQVYGPVAGKHAVQAALDRGATIVSHTNYDLRWLMLDGVSSSKDWRLHDTKVMAWLLDGTQELSLAALCSKYLGVTPAKPIHSKGGRVFFHTREHGAVPIEDVPEDELHAYNLSDIEHEAALYLALKAELQRLQMWERFEAEEAPFSKLLCEMEIEGMPFDKDAADELLEGSLLVEAEIRERLIEATGYPDFNPGSGDQVAAFLYQDVWTASGRFPIPRWNGAPADEKKLLAQQLAPDRAKVFRVGRDFAYYSQQLPGLGLAPPKVKRHRDAPSPKRPTTAAKLLLSMYPEHPWIVQFDEWKKRQKLHGYLVDWLAREHKGRLHGRFDQSGTITGRLASREPNLQQVASDSGVRDLFRGQLVVGDYGGLEARLAAHFSGDPLMLETFREGHDLYGMVAANAWGGPPTKENDRRALMKVVWLASQYGAQGDTLARTMAVNGLRGYTADEADELLATMKAQVPRLFQWRDDIVAEARAVGFVTTWSGRRRTLADIKSPDWQLRYRAERQAVNSMVQGSAADITRTAMLRCREAIPRSVARMILQVHDEILFERGPMWSDDWFPTIVEICEDFDLKVPLKFEAVIAQSWAAKGGATLLQEVQQ